MLSAGPAPESVHCKQAAVILCHVTRRVSEERIISLASAAGLVLQNKVYLDGAIRLLSFQRQQNADMHPVEVLQQHASEREQVL